MMLEHVLSPLNMLASNGCHPRQRGLKSGGATSSWRRWGLGLGTIAPRMVGGRCPHLVPVILSKRVEILYDLYILLIIIYMHC